MSTVTITINTIIIIVIRIIIIAVIIMFVLLRPPAVAYSYVRKGGGYGWRPSSSSNLSIRAFRAQIYQFELFELSLLLNSNEPFPVEHFVPSGAVRGNSISGNRTLPPP